MLQNKETTVQSYRKMSGEMVVGYSRYLNSSRYFCFVTNLRKNFMAYVRLQLNLIPLYKPVRF